MTEQDKVTVDDIIGIVKTEEQTNSVEEVRKLRGRGNETTKRFTINGKEIIQDKQVWCMAHSEHCADVIAEALNMLCEENEQLKSFNQDLSENLSVCADKRLTQGEYLTKLTNENEQLKIRFNEERERALKFGRDIDTLTVQNKQLQARNARQAKRLAELYELMAKKDWESLTEIIDDFCSCEEQLQREWRTYE